MPLNRRSKLCFRSSSAIARLEDRGEVFGFYADTRVLYHNLQPTVAVGIGIRAGRYLFDSYDGSVDIGELDGVGQDTEKDLFEPSLVIH